MGPDHPAPAQPVGPAPGRAVALPRPGDALRAPRLRLGLQADHPGTAVVPDPAAADHDHLHGHLRPHRQPAHRRPAAVPVLHVGHGGMVYFADCLNKTSVTFVQNANLFGKVYFPRLAVPVSILISNLITFRHPVCALPGLRGLFHRPGAHRHPPQLGMDRILAGAGADDGRAGAGLWHHRLLPHHQVPRPALSGQLRRDAADVRHPGDLPGLIHPGTLPDHHQAKPDDAHRGDLPLCLPGSRDGAALGPVIQLRLHGGDRRHRLGDVQPGRSHFHGYSMSNTVIRVENLSKVYRLGQIGTGTFTNDLKVWWAKKRNRPTRCSRSTSLTTATAMVKPSGRSKTSA